MALSDEKKLLLLKAHENNGRLKMSMAEQLYSSKSSAKSAVSSLEFKGYVERHVPGVFKVKKLPDSVHRRIQDKEERESKENDYEKKPVEA